jgi:hypothetical protein
MVTFKNPYFCEKYVFLPMFQMTELLIVAEDFCKIGIIELFPTIFLVSIHFLFDLLALILPPGAQVSDYSHSCDTGRFYGGKNLT